MTHPLGRVAALGAAASAVAVVARVIASYDHGIWLVAYLFLVGTLAPALLAWGERRLLAAGGDGAQPAAGLWLAGVVAVPAGVLGDSRLLVCAGAVCLLAALALIVRRAYAGGAAAAAGRSRAELAAHALTIVVMVVSTGIGVLLAWDYPWI